MGRPADHKDGKVPLFLHWISASVHSQTLDSRLDVQGAYMPTISALGRLGQEDGESQASLGYIRGMLLF